MSGPLTTKVVYQFTTTTKKWLDDMGQEYVNERSNTVIMTDEQVAARELADMLCDHVFNTVSREGYAGLPPMDHTPVLRGEDEFASDFDERLYAWTMDGSGLFEDYKHALYWECLMFTANSSKGIGDIALASRKHRLDPTHNPLVDLVDMVRDIPKWKHCIPLPSMNDVLAIAERMVMGTLSPDALLIDLSGNDFDGSWSRCYFRRIEVRNVTTRDYETEQSIREYEAYRNSEQYKQDLQDERDAALTEREMGNPNTYERDVI